MELTEDGLLNGRVRLRQPKAGYRAGMDAALLAAACDAAPGSRVIEAGCGAGGALLTAAWRRTGVAFIGVERDPAAVALAQVNVGLNGLADRVTAVVGDVAAGFSALNLPPFDAALANPPYFDDPSALRAPSPAKAGAWMADDGLQAWTTFLLKAVRDGGTLTIIHRADRLADILGLLTPKAGSMQIRPVQSFADTAAKRVVVRAVKSGKGPLRMLPPLVLHRREGGNTAEAEAILRGDAALEWMR